MPSQVCEFSNNWKFLNVVETDILVSANDVCVINKKFSILDSDNGIFLLGKDKFYFPGALEPFLKIPIKVINDANAAALGEYIYGVGKGYKHLVYLFYF